jgi:hypothetical protein
MALPKSVVALAARRSGCVAAYEAIRLDGVTDDKLQWWYRSGLLKRVHRGVGRVAGAPATHESRLWAAILRCGERACAGPRASCWLWGLEGFAKLEKDVVVPAPYRCRGTGFPVLSRTLERRDLVKVRGFPALTRERAIIELAHTLTPKRLRVLIDSARRQGMTIEELRARAVALRETPGCGRGARAVLAVIGSGDLDKESENERELEEFLATTTLQLEWQVDDLVPGRRLDAVDREAELVLEIDSSLWHTLGSDRDADGLRDLEITDETGYEVFHLTLGMVRFEPEETRRRLDAIRAKRVGRRAGA